MFRRICMLRTNAVDLQVLEPPPTTLLVLSARLRPLLQAEVFSVVEERTPTPGLVVCPCPNAFGSSCSDNMEFQFDDDH